MKSILLVLSFAVSFSAFSQTYIGTPSDPRFSECSITRQTPLHFGTSYKVQFINNQPVAPFSINEEVSSVKNGTRSDNYNSWTRVKLRSAQITNHFTIQDGEQKIKGTMILDFHRDDRDLISFDFFIKKTTTAPIRMVQQQCEGFLCGVKVEIETTKAYLGIPGSHTEEISVSCLDLELKK